MSYLELAANGKNNWWRYLLSLFLIVIFWQLLGAIPLFILMATVNTDTDPATSFDATTFRFSGVDPIISYTALNFSFLTLLLGLFLAIRLLHQRGFLSLINPNLRLNWSRLATGFGVYFGLMALMLAFSYMTAPENFKLTFDAKAFFLFLPLAIILTPLQAGSEELLFRGYIMQGLGYLTHNKITAAVGSAVLFMLPHLLNPEAKLDPIIMPLTYLTLGLFLAIITLKDNSLELAIGVHSANNLFTFLFSNYEGSALASPSVFTETDVDPSSSLIALLLLSVIFYLIVFYLLPKLTKPKTL